MTAPTSLDFLQQVKLFLARAAGGLYLPDPGRYRELGCQIRRRYLYVELRSGFLGRPYDQADPFCFIDVATGDVLYPQNRHRPAPGARGNIGAEDHLGYGIGPWGALTRRQLRLRATAPRAPSQPGPPPALRRRPAGTGAAPRPGSGRRRRPAAAPR